MSEAYSLAHQEIIKSLVNGGKCLDCGASQGHKYYQLNDLMELDSDRYFGIEWDEHRVFKAREST